MTEEEFKHLCRYSPEKAGAEYRKLMVQMGKLKANNDWLMEEFTNCCKETKRLRAELKQLQGETQ